MVMSESNKPKIDRQEGDRPTTAKAEADDSARRAVEQAATAGTVAGNRQQNSGDPGGTSSATQDPSSLGDEDRALEALEADAAGEPAPGEYTCLRCTRKVAELK